MVTNIEWVGLSILMIIIVLGGIGYVITDKSYFCQSRGIAMECERFSGSGNRCYPNLLDNKGYRDCSDGWIKLSDYVEPEEEEIITPLKTNINFAKDISLNYYSVGDVGYITTGQGDECNFTMDKANITFRPYIDGVEFDLKGKCDVSTLYYACNNKKAMNFFSFKTVEKEINHSGKLQAFDYSDDKEKGEVIFSLQDKYFLSPTDECNYDPTFQITNITDNTIKEDVRCEGGGQYCHTALNDSLNILYYPFDIDEGILARDWSDNDNDANGLSGITWTSSGKFDGGMDFPGGFGDQINIDSKPPIVSVPFAVCMWIFTDFTGGSDTLFTVGNSTDPGETQSMDLRYGVTQNQSRAFSNTGSGGFDAATSAVNSLRPNVWTHICGVWASTSSRFIYVNAVGTENTGSNIGTVGQDRVSFGGSVPFNFAFKGQMDEIILWNRSLSAAEITLVYDSQYAKFKSLGNHTINVTIGLANTINVTLNLSNQNNTNISLAIQHTGGFTSYINMTNGVTQNFSIDLSTEINLSMIYYPDEFGMWSPILLNNITLVTYNISVGDEPPTITNFQDNASAATTNGTDVQLNATIADDIAVDFYILATNNTNGNVMTNQTPIDAGDAASVLGIFNESLAWFVDTGGTFGWQVWANDSIGQETVSAIQTVTIASQVADSCTYSGSGTYTPLCSDNCNEGTIDLLGNNIIIDGIGTFIGNLINFGNLTVTSPSSCSADIG